MLTSKYNNVVSILGPPDASFTRTETAVPSGAVTNMTFAWWMPVTNRTLNNCVYGDPIGCIDRVLMNRLEANADYVSRLFTEALIQCGTLSEVSTVWDRSMYVYYADLARIRNNIATLRATGIFEIDTPTPVLINANDFPTFDIINGWEKCLLDIKNLLDGMSTNLVRRLGTFTLSTTYGHQVIRR